MKRFEFRLARLERIKHIFEEEARQTWAVSERTAREREDAVADADRAIVRSRGELRAIQAEEHPPIAEVLAGQSVIDDLVRRRATLRRSADEARAAADELRGEWEEKRAEVRALGRLEERALAEYRTTEKKAEAARMDEVALDLDGRARRKARDTRRD